MRVIVSLSLFLIFFIAAIFVVNGQAEPTLAPTIPPPPTLLTPIPTFTPTPITFEADINTLYSQIVSEAGFEHPELITVAQKIAQFSDAAGRSFQIRKNTFGDVDYTFIYFPSPSSMYGFVLFVQQNGKIDLISNFPAFVAGLEEIADRNGNGLPDFAFTEYSGGNCCPPTHLWVLEIQTDSSVKNITPNGRGDAQELIDLDGDGIFEIKGVTWVSPIIVHIPHEVILLTRIYGWNGTAYVDISAEQTSFYDTKITTLRRKLAHADCAVHEPSILQQILLDYYAMGRLEEGWQELRPTLNMSRCLKYRTEAILLNTFQHMVDNNQPWQ